MLKRYFVVILSSVVSLAPAVSYAQDSGSAQPPSLKVEKSERPLDPGVIRASVQKWRFETTDAPAPLASETKKRLSNGKRAGLIAAGAVAGFFAGAYAGSYIENQFAPCNCDDPGVLGILWGAPIGAVVGAVATAIAVK